MSPRPEHERSAREIPGPRVPRTSGWARRLEAEDERAFLEAADAGEPWAMAEARRRGDQARVEGDL